MRRTTSSLLRGEGYVLREAANGAEALAILDRDADVALIVSDVVMPGMTGLDLVTEARVRRPVLAAILVSGYSPDVLRDGPSVPPSVAFLSKPFKASDLFRAVRAALDRETATASETAG